MKRNIAYVLGLILMFSTSGVYLNAQGMGGGGYGMDDDGMRMHQKEGMRERAEISDDGYRKNIRIIKKKKRGGKDGFSPKDMKMGHIQDMEDEVISTIKKHDSSFAKKLEKLKDTDRRKYKLILRNSAKPLMMCKRNGGDVAMEKDMVEAIKLEYETRELSFKYKKASSGEKKDIEKSLQVKVSKLFDLRAKGQELRIKKMTKEIGKLQAKMKDRRAHKSEIVKTRVDKLTGQGYTW